MIIPANINPINWNKSLYIASKINVSYDEEGNEITNYSNPLQYSFNYQTLNSNSEISEFGEKTSIMKKAVIPISYINQFKEFDVAYLDDVTPTGETKNGDNANYRLLPPRNGNSVIIIYFEKLTGK